MKDISYYTNKTDYKAKEDSSENGGKQFTWIIPIL